MKAPYQYNWRKRRFFFLPVFLVGLFAMSAIVMFLWNAVIPDMSGLLPLTYWQAMGILILSRILFSGFRFGGHHRHRPPFMHPPLKNKLMQMNDEEREQFKNQWKERFCK